MTEEIDLTMPFKATYSVWSDEARWYDSGLSPYTTPMNLIFKNKRQFLFFQENPHLLNDIAEKLCSADKEFVMIERILLTSTRGDFERPDIDIPNYDCDPDSPTFINKKIKK